MFSHFALSDSHDKTYAKLQAERFQAAAKAVKDAGVSIAIHHLANSAAILDMPEVHFDMVRAGIILYGLCPSAESGQQADIWPAMKVITRLGLVKDMQPGEKISYGCTYTVARPSRIATLPFWLCGWLYASFCRQGLDRITRPSCADSRTYLHGSVHG